MGNKFDEICEVLKKYEYELNKDDGFNVNLYDALIDGHKITKPRVQSIFRNLVKSVSSDTVVSFNKTFGYIPIVHIDRI